MNDTSIKQTTAAADVQKQREAGKADSEKLMEKWVEGEGNTSNRNFTTPGDKAGDKVAQSNFDEVLADEGEPSYQNPDVKKTN